MMRFINTLLALSTFTVINSQLPEGFEPGTEGAESDIHTLLRNLADEVTVSACDKNTYENRDLLNGPWPECIGMTAPECQNYIAELMNCDSRAFDRSTLVHIVSSSVWEYRKDRVWIQCDEEGNVLQAPQRG